jgi:hypothetical protein
VITVLRGYVTGTQPLRLALLVTARAASVLLQRIKINKRICGCGCVMTFICVIMKSNVSDKDGIKIE